MTVRAIDAIAWEAAYREHAGHLTRLATVLVGPDGAHDLVSETVLRCVSSDGWPAVANPGGYLTRALVREASTLGRSEGARRRREWKVAAWRPAATEDTQHQPASTDALRSLSPTQAAIVYLLYWEDMTIPDAARRLEMSEGSVRKQLDRAKKRLRKVMTDDDHE